MSELCNRISKILVTCITIHCMCAMRTLWVHSNWVAFCLLFFILDLVGFFFGNLSLYIAMHLYRTLSNDEATARPMFDTFDTQYVYIEAPNRIQCQSNQSNQTTTIKWNERMKISLSTINVIDVWSFDNGFMSNGNDSPSMNANLHTCFKFLHGLLFKSSFTISLFLPPSPFHLGFPITCS